MRDTNEQFPSSMKFLASSAKIRQGMFTHPSPGAQSKFLQFVPIASVPACTKQGGKHIHRASTGDELIIFQSCKQALQFSEVHEMSQWALWFYMNCAIGEHWISPVMQLGNHLPVSRTRSHLMLLSTEEKISQYLVLTGKGNGSDDLHAYFQYMRCETIQPSKD